MKKIALFLMLCLSLGIIHAALDRGMALQSETELDESLPSPDIESHDLLSRRDVTQTQQNCLIAFSGIVGLIQILQQRGLSANQIQALETWFRVYTETRCYNYTGQNCDLVYNNITGSIGTLETKGLSDVQAQALEQWLRLFCKMRCYDYAGSNCEYVFNSISGLIGQSLNFGLTGNQILALEAWFRLYKELDCAGCFSGSFSGTCCSPVSCCNSIASYQMGSCSPMMGSYLWVSGVGCY